MRNLILILFSLNVFAGGPFSPPAYISGSTAISKDSKMITAWSTGGYVEYMGYKNIERKDLGFTSMGSISNTFGKSDRSILSLGDSGVVVLTFDNYISDNDGYDLAVFENSFDGLFLELAFVEVSSDGINFFRFPSTSLTDTSVNIGGFGNLDATNLNNLAGKYSADYGTPFDLADIPDNILLNKQSIQYVKIIDVIGTNSHYASLDSKGNKIIDPFPTPFSSGGFDLDAVAILGVGTTVNKVFGAKYFPYPNPTSSILNFDFEGVKVLYDILGNEILTTSMSFIDLSNLPNGAYFVTYESKRIKIIKI